MLTHDQARAVYDRVGARQDQQGWYEDAALDELIAHADFERAGSVFELGCGTARLADELLASRLPADARYLGVDSSPTMIGLASARLERFGDRARVRLVDGKPKIGAPAKSFERFLSTYVFDLLPESEVRAWLAEADRVLVPGGRLALAGLAPGTTVASRLVSGLWTVVQRLRPALVGGCRPLAVHPLLDAERWRVLHRAVVTPRAIASEVLVAERLPG